MAVVIGNPGLAGPPKPPKPPKPPAPPNPGAPPAPPAAPPQIPGAGTYLQQQAQATQAYENAKNDINYRRGQMYSQFGLLPNGQVDPNAKYGQYQQMLGGDASQLGQARNAQQARGIGTAGLGGRVMQGLRDAQGGEHFGFQQTLMNNLHGFDVEGQNAQQTYSGSLLAAQQAQEQWDFEHNQFAPPADPAAPTTPAPPAAKAPLRKATKSAAPLRQQLLAQRLAARKATTSGRRP